MLRVIARLNLGGPAHQAALLSGRRFHPERYETLLVHGRLAPGEESMADLAQAEGARMVYLESLGPEISPVADVRALGSLARLIRRYRPDIVHTHTAKAGFVGRAAALAGGPRPKLVHTYHGHVLEGYFGPAKTRLYRGLERRLGRFTDRLIGVSEATVDDLVRLGVAPREKFEVISLGLDLSGYRDLDPALGRALRDELGLSQGDVVAVFIGRLVAIKRLDVMLEALARARAVAPALRLVVIGDGELRGELEATARRLGVADAVRFAGYRRDLRPAFAAADFAAISSDNEGTPVSLIEAGAAGLPAAATAVGGVAKVVGDDAGLLVGPADPGALASAMARLAESADLRRKMGDAARARMATTFSAERLVEDVDELYGDVLATRRAA